MVTEELSRMEIFARLKARTLKPTFHRLKCAQDGIKEIILNLNDVRRHILQVLGPPFQKIYANAF